MVNDPELDLRRIIGDLKEESSTCYVRREKVKLYDVSPAEFLSFARQDLEEDSERGRINAIRNAKTAIECRADEILTFSNLKSFSSRSRWGLPYKLLVLRKLGLSAPDVLRDYITSKRNLIEHEYVRPSREETRHLADITELFLSATDKYVEEGYISSATITIRHEVERRKISARLDRGYGFDIEYKLNFDLKNGVLTVATQPFEWWTEYHKITGKIEEKRKPPGEPDVRNITISDCKEADVTELMKLIVDKAD